MEQVKKNMNDDERNELIIKMQKDLEDFIQERTAVNQERKKNEPEEEKSLDEIVEELKQHPAFMTEFDPTKEMSPAMEALQQIKYESTSDYSSAESYKDDGNYNFKFKKYRWAIDNYTQGIKEKAPHKLVNAILYTNRAACQFHLGNFRSSLNDCVLARKFKLDHLKAIARGVQCCFELKRYKEAVTWCDHHLALNPTEDKFLELRSQADKNQRQIERDERKERTKERKQQMEEDKLIKLVQSRGIKLEGGAENEDCVSLLASLESHHPSGAKVRVDSDGCLHWPVLFMYPEYGQTDFIESFSENDTLLDHIELMFGPGVEPTPWDKERKYKPHNIEVYFEDKHKEKLYKVNTKHSLRQVLNRDRYVVQGGMPSFIILVTNTDFAQEFMKKYKL